MKHYTLNIHGKLIDLREPQVMGIVNVTPDSFYSGSRISGLDPLHKRIDEIIIQGGSMVDIGAYSSRRDADNISPEEEASRLRPALKFIRENYPDLVISVDTFRADIAKMCVEEYGVSIINDISGGEIDKDMFKTVARLGVPYILMHMKGTPKTMQQHCQYEDIAADVMDYFIKKIGHLRELGVKDIIIDPGYGFAKTLEQNYQLMSQQDKVCDPLDLPVLVGISRKSMIYKLLGTTPQESLNGTTVLNTYALLKGANILRVHDVKEAVEAVQIVNMLKKGQ